MLAHHPPAVKVGGRRLSAASKMKPSLSHETQETSKAPVMPNDDDVTSDYPRPTHQSHEKAHAPHAHAEKEGKRSD